MLTIKIIIKNGENYRVHSNMLLDHFIKKMPGISDFPLELGEVYLLFFFVL